MSEENTTRDEHLDWCKSRALAYVDGGDLRQAFASMASDLAKHSATAGHSGIVLGFGLMFHGHLDTPALMREFIEYFK